MTARLIAAACAVAGVVTVAVPITAGASTGPNACLPGVFSITAPDAKAVAQHYGVAGARVTVMGANFSQAGCTLTAVQVGSATIPRAVVTVAPGGSRLTFRLPTGASGAVRVISTDSLGDRKASDDNFVFIQTPTAAVKSVHPTEGALERVSGRGYAPFVHGVGRLPGARVSGSYAQCNGRVQMRPATPLSDSSVTLRAPSMYCDGPLEMVFVAPMDTNRPIDCRAAPASVDYNCIRLAVKAGIVDIAFHVTLVSPPAGAVVPSGSSIRVTGSGFGASGDATLGGAAAAAAWSDTSIVVTAPARGETGALTVQRSTGDLQEVQLGRYSVISAPAMPSPARISHVQPRVAAGPARRPHVAAVAIHTTPSASPTARPGPAPTMRLRLQVARHVAKPGSRVAFAVTLMAGGKPARGAVVNMKLTRSPGKGARVIPATGRTGRAGMFRGAVILGKTPGLTCVLATSGKKRASACISDVEALPKASAVPFGGFIDPQRPVAAWFTVAGIALVVFAILVNINVVGRVVLSRTSGRLGRRRGRGST